MRPRLAKCLDKIERENKRQNKITEKRDGEIEFRVKKGQTYTVTCRVASLLKNLFQRIFC